MKKFAFLALVFFFFYAAGMYESQALLVVSLTQALLMVLMLMLSIYFKQSLEVTFSEKTVFAVKEEPFIWNIRVRNRGRLPVSKFLLKVWIEQKGSSLREKRKIYGNGDCGEHQLPFQETLFHCGIVIFHGAQLKVYDYLSLFVRKRSLEEEMELIVFPEDLEMLIEIRFRAGDPESSRQEALPHPGNAQEEIRQIREYREGDPTRHIHWNQTARSGQLWVKEYEEEQKLCFSLFLDLGIRESDSLEELDGFYTLLYALTGSLLKKGSLVRVCWMEGKAPAYMELSDQSQRRTLLLRLYQDQSQEERPEGKASPPEPGPGAMRLTRRLEWFVEERLIFRFSAERAEEEIEGQVFQIEI